MMIYEEELVPVNNKREVFLTAALVADICTALDKAGPGGDLGGAANRRAPRQAVQDPDRTHRRVHYHLTRH